MIKLTFLKYFFFYFNEIPQKKLGLIGLSVLTFIENPNQQTNMRFSPSVQQPRSP